MKRPHLYTEHFGLQKPPFGLSPQPDFFFGGADRDTILRQLVYFADQGEGVALITGEVGAGKTMLLTMLMEDCRRSSPNILPILINRMMLSPADLAHTMAEQLAIVDVGAESNLQILQVNIEAKLIALFAEGRRTLVVVDEAHALPSQCLEWLRLLTNLETSQGKMLQLMLFGQPEILSRLSSPELRALADRITLNIALRGMNQSETTHYLQHRLRLAGFRGDELFSPPAARKIAKHTGGLSRKIHVLADKSLLAAFAADASRVNLEHVQQAIDDNDVNGRNVQQIYRPTSEPEHIPWKMRWAQFTHWFGSPSGMAWIMLLLMMVGVMVITWFPRTHSPLVDTAKPNLSSSPLSVVNTSAAPIAATVKSSRPTITAPVWHEGIQFNWAEAQTQTQALMSSSPTTLSQSLQRHPHGVYIRLISEVANAEQAERWLIAINRLAQESWQGSPVTSQGEPLEWVAYRFQEGRKKYWRLIVVGYPDVSTAQTDINRWQTLLSKVLRKGNISIRPLSSLMP